MSTLRYRIESGVVVIGLWADDEDGVECAEMLRRGV